MKPDPLHDFDFLFGSWNVHHRRLKERLAGCSEWIEFDGTSTARPLLGRQGNVDDNLMNMPDGAYRGASVRTFNPDTATWAIWWIDSRYPHTLDAPVVGGFEGGVGTFYCDDTLRGQPIRVRYQWSNITPDSCRWEQAFSPDAGKSWEVNWEMQFTRSA